MTKETKPTPSLGFRVDDPWISQGALSMCQKDEILPPDLVEVRHE